MSRHLLVWALVIFCPVAVGCSGGKKSGTGAAGVVIEAPPPKVPKPLDVAFIPTDAVFALVVDPYQMINAEGLSPLEGSTMSPLLQPSLGVDAANVEQWIVTGGTGAKLGDFFYGSIYRFNKDVNQAQQLCALGPNWEEVADGDRKYHRPKPAGGSCVYFANDRTMVMASEDTLKKMLSVAKDAESPLLTTLRKSTDASAALVVLEVDPIRGAIGTYLLFSKPPFPFDTPPLDKLKDAIKYISEAVVRLDTTPDVSVNGTLRTKDVKDDNGAEAVETLVNDVVAKLNEAAEARVKATANSRGGLGGPGAVARILQTTAEKLKTGLKLNRQKDAIDFAFAGEPFAYGLGLFAPQLLQPVKRSMQQAQQAASRENLARIAAALDAHIAAKGAYPAPASTSADGKPLLSWRVHLLPMLGEQALYEEFHLDEPWDSAHNKKLVYRIPAAYRDAVRVADGKTMYLLPTGAGTLFASSDGPKLDAITDDKGTTIVVIESTEGPPVEWTKPADLAFDPAKPTKGVAAIIRPVFFVLFADGSVRALNAYDDDKALPGMFSPAGGEPPPAKKE
ncbi:MAG: DUF1559 domain-containing protein [Planctomycetia bacterium]|nr:DUF1559 domain-containing protein [Planctomycetia bacterium]